MQDISEQEILVFVDAVRHYFFQITMEKAEISGAYLAQGELATPIFDYSGLISISGDYLGRIYFSAPRIMLSELLLLMHEPKLSDMEMLDAVGEIANTIAGNARKHFGDNLKISVPQTALKSQLSKQTLNAIRARAYVIMIKWRRYEAAVVIDISRR